MPELIKIFINPKTAVHQRPETAYRHQLHYLKKVWNDDSFGIERIARLFICAVQFIYPVLLIRDIFGRAGVIARKLAVELYTILKFVFPLFVLGFGLYRFHFAIAVVIYLLSETIVHILHLIFLSDIHSASVSYRRSILLLFLHYLEAVFDFAVIYIGFDILSEPLTPVSAVYFSMVTNTTVGFGDIHAKGPAGQLVVISQLVVCVLFVVLFINYFSSRVNEHHQ